MTDAKRGAMLLLLGLFTAVLLYPALHEGGHILVTLLLGGRIREVRLGRTGIYETGLLAGS